MWKHWRIEKVEIQQIVPEGTVHIQQVLETNAKPVVPKGKIRDVVQLLVVVISDLFVVFYKIIMI
jgi:hypothetical protein